jgi:hypothetical protein
VWGGGWEAQLLTHPIPIPVSIVPTSFPPPKADVPVLILFRALGCVSDREILEHIVYDWWVVRSINGGG